MYIVSYCIVLYCSRLYYIILYYIILLIHVYYRGQTSGTPPSARACHTLTRLAHKLYMFGGYDGAKCFNDLDAARVERVVAL